MRFLAEVIENVLRYFLDTQWVQKGLLVFSRAEFFSSVSVSRDLNCGRTSL